MAKNTAVDLENLQRENEILRQKLAAQEAVAAEQSKIFGGSLANEMRKIRQKGRNETSELRVREFTDHKNISLWTKWGKRVGPLHPDNAIQALNRYADMGVYLSTDCPTAEQVDTWRKSVEGKAFIKAEHARRNSRDKSRKADKIGQLTEAIAKMSGVKPSEVNNILSPDEVRAKA